MSTSVELDSHPPFLSINLPDSSEVYRRIQEQVVEHPYRTLAVAAGVGFVLGGGLLSRATGKMVANGLRMGMAAVVAPIAAQMVGQMLGGRSQQRTH